MWRSHDGSHPELLPEGGGMTKEEKAVIKAAMSWAYTFNRGSYELHLDAGVKLRQACAALKKTKKK
jgi:hypothetical protein